MLQRPVETREYSSHALERELRRHGALASMGSVADCFDNALAESVIGLFKAELIGRHGPWRTADQVELATARWVDWWNRERLHSACGDAPPAEFEATYHRQLAATAVA